MGQIRKPANAQSMMKSEKRGTSSRGQMGGAPPPPGGGHPLNFLVLEKLFIKLHSLFRVFVGKIQKKSPKKNPKKIQFFF
jgi:hypothetical protein